MNLTDKTETLIGALPYIKKYNKKIVVIKFGGDALGMKNVIEDVVLLKNIGMKPVIIHGGGPKIDMEMNKAKIKPKFIHGLRFTDEKTLKIVKNVFNKINNEIVKSLKNHRTKAINASGFIEVKQKDKNLGFVGKIVKINNNKLKSILDSDFIPVISPIGIGLDKKEYNINADTVASHVAVSLKAEKLTIATNVDGIKINGKLQTHVDFNTAKSEIKSGMINKGMIPKVEACIYAVKNKCPKAHLINGLIPHSLLLEIFTDKGIGTEIVYENGHKTNN